MKNLTFVLFACCIYCRITLVFSKNETLGPELVFVHVLYRHGDRSPGSLYPKDPHGPENWPMGLKELTKEGMLQQYRLGKYLRKRYSKLLNERYLVDEILQVNNPCPTYDVIFRNQTKNIIDYYNNRYVDLFSYIKTHSGLKELDFLGIGKIYDPLYCESVHKLKLPGWTKTTAFDKTGKTVYELIVEMKKIAKNVAFDSDGKALRTGGPLLGDIINRMIAVSKANRSASAKPSVKPSKMVMYSGHDDVVLALLYSLNVVKRALMVPYAAAVFFELYRKTDGNYFVEVLYKDDTPEGCLAALAKSAAELGPCVFNKESIRDKIADAQKTRTVRDSDSKEPRQFQILGCPGAQCPLDIFANVLSKRIIYPLSKRDEYCGIYARM